MGENPDFSFLFHLGKRTGLAGKYSSSTGEIAREAGLSQQSVSRKLVQLEKKGLIERNASVKGVTISLSDSGVKVLRGHYLEVEKIFSAGKPKRVHSLAGRVVSGLGEGKYYLSLAQYVEQIEERLGFTPYAGTLNIKVDVPRLESFLSALTPVYVHGFETKERTFGGLTGYGIKVNDRIDGALVIPDRTSHERDVVEIIAAPYLRKKLGLADGSKINVSHSE